MTATATADEAPAGIGVLLRSAAFNAVFFVYSAATAVIGLALFVGPQRWAIGWVRGWARSIVVLLRVICGIRLEVRGRENLPDGPAVIAAKHQSAFDTIVWLALLDAPAYVLKKELLSIPVWGLMARRTGQIAVDRAGAGPALRAMARDAKRRLAEGRPVVIFPEGTRSRPGERLPYQPGVLALAGLGALLVPVATNSGLFWGRRAFVKRPGTIVLSILPPIPPSLRREALPRLEEAIETETARLVAEATEAAG